ncbi:hypothetical protein [Oscillatoria sp. HE19RPO]|uniref:hypothetical protein n=1 Tax=Oscillatoria sp. HE19RPO TaxID=2954806 RepID=UPI0020C3BC11|nr:hypothetical protein [Oscillatoria sp. HE19RPO]
MKPFSIFVCIIEAFEEEERGQIGRSLASSRLQAEKTKPRQAAYCSGMKSGGF